MKFSLNTLRGINERYGCVGDIAPNGIDTLVEKIGGQLGAVDEVVSIGDKYQGIVISKVVSCEKHPNADKLHVCLIDDGGKVADVARNADGYIEVVCGAPNVREGLTVAWLPPGATVPETFDKDPFVLEARELRGVVSNGMLASPKELALGDSHDGILEINGGVAPGSDFAEAYGLKDDVVIEIENKMFTHRPDLFGFLGISRELAGIQGMAFKSPDWYTATPEFPAVEVDELPLTLSNELPELVPRFTAITMSNVEVGPSPVWLQVELAKVGQKSINNIVDYTNWFMLETGQPLHAYDYDKVKALSDGEATIVVRKPHKGEKITLLNGKEIEPRDEAIMIATNKTLIGVGGVMGGSQTEVSADTTNIILECANFDMYSIRRTSMAHGLFTDAVTRFNKGQSPLQNLAVLAKIVAEIRTNAGGRIAGAVIDDNNLDENKTMGRTATVAQPVQVAAEFINQRLGLALTDQDIMTLLENVEFDAHDKGGMNELCIQPPFWRTDIELPEDIVEEVGRLYGYDKLSLELPARDVTPTKRDAMFDLKAHIRAALSRAGANEVLTYSFVHGDLLKKVGQDSTKAFQVANALSPDLQYYRLSLTPSLLDKVHGNNKAGYDTFALFELGKKHQTDALNDEGLPAEADVLALVFAANGKAAQRYAGAAYYQAKRYIKVVLRGISQDVRFVALQDTSIEEIQQAEWLKPFEPSRSAIILLGATPLGVVGEYKASVRKQLKLPNYCAGFEISTNQLLRYDSKPSYVALPRFPKVTQDITLKVAYDVPYQTLYGFLLTELQATQPAHSICTLKPLAIFQKDDEMEYKRVSLRLTIANYERTLTDKEVNRLLESLAAAARTALNAERI